MLSGDVHCNPGPGNSRYVGRESAVPTRSKSIMGQSTNVGTNVIPVIRADDFMEILDSHDSATYSATLVIAGDLNIHVNDESNAEATQFNRILSTYNLTQLVQDPTHESGHTLDLVITRNFSNFVSDV
eukprot:gene12366-3022_t